MNLEKYVFHWENWDIEPIMNSVHIAELPVLGKTLNKNNELFAVLPKQITCERKHLKFQFNNGFIKKKKKLNLSAGG